MLFDPLIDYLEFERSIATKILVCSDIVLGRFSTEQEEGKKKKKNKENKEMEKKKKKKMNVFLFICFIDK